MICLPKDPRALEDVSMALHNLSTLADVLERESTEVSDAVSRISVCLGGNHTAHQESAGPLSDVIQSAVT